MYLSRFSKLLAKPNYIKTVVPSLSRTMTSLSNYNYETLQVTKPEEHVFQVTLNRPEKRNAMNKAFWREMVLCFNQLHRDSDCRVVVVDGAGKSFTSGIDLADFASMASDIATDDPARRAIHYRDFISAFQESFTAIEKCQKPVIAAVHNACVGGGVDLITACDIRYCSNDAWFQVKEVEIGLAADVGTLQRLPKVVGNDSWARELAYTARRVTAPEAKEFGLVSRIFQDKDAVLKGALDTASKIASMSPVAVSGTKVNLVYSRDHSVKEGLEYNTTWNQCMLQTPDIMEAAGATMSKTKPTFSKL